MTSSRKSLIYLDRHHLNDTLFLRAVAHAVAKRPRSWQTAIVHGPGSFVERRLEAKGLFLEMEDGVPVAPPPEIAPFIGTALHDFNQRLARLMTENMVHAVGTAGSDRGLLRWEGGKLHPGAAEWLIDILRAGVVPLISTTAAGSDGTPKAISPTAFLPRLVEVLGGVDEVTFFTRNNLAGVMRGAEPAEYVTMEDVRQADIYTEPEVMEAIVLSGSPVIISNPVRYPATEGLRGSWVQK